LKPHGEDKRSVRAGSNLVHEPASQSSEREQKRRGNFQFIRNPFEALFAAELIADGRDPDIGAVVEENYQAAAV